MYINNLSIRIYKYEMTKYQYYDKVIVIIYNKIITKQ